MGGKRLAFALAGLAVLGLTACEEGDARRERMAGGGGEGGLCMPFTAAQAAGPAAGVDDCLHRWGYALARADDDRADVVAQAVVAACSAPLTRWNQQTLAEGTSPNAPSLLTGEDTNPIAERAAFAQNRALFYVVQARAGHCDPPRAGDQPQTTTAPAGGLSAPAP